MITLSGHADERGTREYNLALGQRRAEAVSDYFVLNGISSERITVKSYGEERPVELGQDEKSYSKNRRVEIN
jgi:peptidoglycan-associated lipoprotein